MKRIIISIYIGTFIWTSLFLAAVVFDYKYLAWEAVISFNDGFIHLGIGIAISVILLIISFSGFYKATKKNLYQYILLIASLMYILTNIILYPYIRIFVGSKLLILLVLIGFAPVFSISFIVVEKEFNLFSKIKKLIKTK